MEKKSHNLYKTPFTLQMMGAKVTARVNIKGKHFEVRVDLDEALKVRAGTGDIISALDCTAIYTDLKKGLVASNADLKDAFGTTDLYEAAKRIIEKGEVQKTQEFRDAEHEKKIKQVLDILLKNAVDQNGRPYTAERLTRAIEEVHYNFDKRPAEQQMPELVHQLKTVIPIKIETKKIKLIIPARFTGNIYGLIKDYMESEEWLGNGDLKVVINIPSGMQMDFFDKLNSVTHGAVQSEELKSE